MEIRITDSLKLQCEIPFVLIEKFQFVWEPNQHAVLHKWKCTIYNG